MTDHHPSEKPARTKTTREMPDLHKKLENAYGLPYIAQSQTCVKCRQEFPAEETVCPHCNTVVGSAEAQKTGDTNKLPEKNPDAYSPAVVAKDVVLILEAQGKQISLPVAEELTLGRFGPNDEGQKPDVALNDFAAEQNGISRRHAKLIRKNSLVYLMDLGSTNGTFLNGQRLLPNAQRMLRRGDEIYLGYLRVYIRF